MTAARSADDATVAPPRDPRDLITCLLALTFVTGIVDAVGYLGLDRVFTGNMTGNVVILGMGLAGADGLPVLGPAIALVAFMLGAFAAGLVLRRRDPRWDRSTTTLLATGGVLLAAVTGALTLVPHTGTITQVFLAAGTALAMGVQAATARHLAVKDLPTVVVTSTLTALASHSWTSSGAASLLNRRVGAVVCILLGAAFGALLLQVHIAIPMAVATAITVVVVIVGEIRFVSNRSEP